MMPQDSFIFLECQAKVRVDLLRAERSADRCAEESRESDAACARVRRCTCWERSFKISYPNDLQSPAEKGADLLTQRRIEDMFVVTHVSVVWAP